MKFFPWKGEISSHSLGGGKVDTDLIKSNRNINVKKLRGTSGSASCEKTIIQKGTGCATAGTRFSRAELVWREEDLRKIKERNLQGGGFSERGNIKKR